MQIRKSFVAGAGVLLVAAILAGAIFAWWAWSNLYAQILLKNQQAQIVISDPMDVGIDILDNLDILLDTQLKTSVPIDQVLSLPVRDVLKVDVTFNHEVPIKMNVPIHETVQLDQTVDVDGEVQANFLGRWITLPVKGSLPVKAEVPIDIDVPVDQQVNLSFTAPAEVKLLQDLKVPLKTVIDTTIPLKSELSVPVRSRLNAKAQILETATAIIAKLDLQLPVHGIGLSFNEKNPSPQDEPATTSNASDNNTDNDTATSEQQAPEEANPQTTGDAAETPSASNDNNGSQP